MQINARADRNKIKMEFGYTRTAIICVLCIYFVHNVVGMPKTIPKPEEVVPVESFGIKELEKSKTDETITSKCNLFLILIASTKC